MNKDDYEQLTALAKEGISSRPKIASLKKEAEYYKAENSRAQIAYNRLRERYDALVE